MQSASTQHPKREEYPTDSAAIINRELLMSGTRPFREVIAIEFGGMYGTTQFGQTLRDHVDDCAPLSAAVYLGDRRGRSYQKTIYGTPSTSVHS